jgi:hypothetical protein
MMRQSKRDKINNNYIRNSIKFCLNGVIGLILVIIKFIYSICAKVFNIIIVYLVIGFLIYYFQDEILEMIFKLF